MATLQEKIDYILTQSCTAQELHTVMLAQKAINRGDSSKHEFRIEPIYIAKGGV